MRNLSSLRLSHLVQKQSKEVYMNYKLSDLDREYSLDYCVYNQDQSLDFSYKGKKGHYEIGWKNCTHKGVLTIDGTNYILHKDRYFSFNNVFTTDDLPMLIAIANGSVLREFPFQLDSGDIVVLRLSGDWLFDLGESVLASDKDTNMFYVKCGVLYVDNKPVDAYAISKFYETDNNVYTYGLQDSHTELCISLRFRAGCKFEYLQEFLARLPIKSGSYCINVCNRYGYIDSGLDYITDSIKEVNATPLSKIANYRLPETVQGSVIPVKFEVKSF